MAHLLQVGAGSGGMPVLDLLLGDPRITHVTLIEPDLYKPHNVERHLFPLAYVGEFKGSLAHRWIKERRPDIVVDLLQCDLMDPARQAEIGRAAAGADIGICAADNEPAKYHWDGLMRQHRKPWTLGEVLSGGIGGFVHWFYPGGPCYGCVAGYLQRTFTVEPTKAADYSQPSAALAEIRIPASKAAIHTIASFHALVTLGLLEKGAEYSPGFTTLLFTLERVPEVFEEAYRSYRFSIPRASGCLICRSPSPDGPDASSPEQLDVALDEALARLGDA
jgi:molybdopterin/thiamine biosynthesis adenylyltransferase